MRTQVFLLRALCLCFTLIAVRATAGTDNQRGVAATVQAAATEAAINAMKRGGNAIDAAVAAGLTLGVVDGFNSGIGGGCFLLIRLADGRFIAIDGREMAPAGATRDMYIRNGKADTTLSQTGALASGVPGALAAYDHAVSKYGKLKLKDLLLPAAEIAEKGFPIHAGYFRKIQSVEGDLKKFPSSRAVFFHENGDIRKTGETLKQAELAKTYRAIANEGTGWFYRGPFAQKTAEWMKENGGLITVDDFKNYQAKQRDPLVTSYRGHQIVGFPPPSSGGIHVAQILNMLEKYDVKKFGANSADFVHVITEAMKLAFADRAYWLGDPDFAKVPRGLIAKAYTDSLAGKIDLKHATKVPQHGTPDAPQDDIFGKHTTHFSTADAAGNWVACTATINTSFGSKVVVPGTGVVLNNEMDDFSAQPGVPNHFGLVGMEANAVAPGKRPLSSMSPTIVLKDGKPILAVGAAGGPTIITQTLLAIVNVIDFGRSPAEALAQPRFHQQWIPDELKIENKLSGPVLKELEKRGHKLNPSESFGACQAVGLTPDGFVGAADPRLNGKAATW